MINEEFSFMNEYLGLGGFKSWLMLQFELRTDDEDIGGFFPFANTS